MLRRSAALAAALLVLAGCAGIGGDDAGTIEAGNLPELVLRPEDLTNADAWLLFDEGPQAQADAPLGPRADPNRFGRVEGWKARYRRGGTAATRGPLVVESRADLFAGEDGAKDDFRAIDDDIEAGRLLTAGERVDVPALGDESVAVTLRQGEGSAALRYYLVAWRHDALTASVLVNGFDQGTKLADALELARKQQLRIQTASAE